MTSPLVLGLFHASACRVWSMESRRVRAVAAEAALQGVSLGLFGTTDIDFDASTVRYTRMTPEGWVPWRGPLPDVVLRGGSIPSDADSPAVARLRTMVPFAGRGLPNKAVVLEALQATAIAPHVIPFRRVVGPDAEAVIAAVLDEHRRVVLKPASEHLGKGVTFVACDGDDLVIRQNELRWRLPRQRALAELAGRIGTRPWIIQNMIISRVRDGRVFDVRVHVHKDGAGRWTLVRSYVRLSDAGMLVSNTGRGGFQGDLNAVLAGLGVRGEALATTIRRLGLRVGETLDSTYHGRLDEVGVDILVDPQHWPWIAEVNSGPVTRYHEFERARLHVAYAMHVARRFKAEIASGATPRPSGSR